MDCHSMMIGSDYPIMDTTANVANRIGVSLRTLQLWCATGRVPGAQKIGRDWLIPDDAEIDRPKMGRPPTTGALR